MFEAMSREGNRNAACSFRQSSEDGVRSFLRVKLYEYVTWTNEEL